MPGISEPAGANPQEAVATSAPALTLTPLPPENHAFAEALAGGEPAATALTAAGHHPRWVLPALALVLSAVLIPLSLERWGKNLLAATVPAVLTTPSLSVNPLFNQATVATPALTPTPHPQVRELRSNFVPKTASAMRPAADVVPQGGNTEGLTSAYAALAAGRMDEAERLYAEALTALGEEPDALLGLAYIAHRRDRPEAALAYYRRVLRQDPDQAAALAGLLALNKELDLAQAASRAHDTATQHPESAAALSALGRILGRQERFADAALAFARAQALEPVDPNHAYNLAVALDRLRQYGRAQHHYARALALAEHAQDVQATGFSRTEARLRLEQLRQALEQVP